MIQQLEPGLHITYCTSFIFPAVHSCGGLILSLLLPADKTAADDNVMKQLLQVPNFRSVLLRVDSGVGAEGGGWIEDPANPHWHRAPAAQSLAFFFS
jgi:hypothetical protein